MVSGRHIRCLLLSTSLLPLKLFNLASVNTHKAYSLLYSESAILPSCYSLQPTINPSKLLYKYTGVFSSEICGLS